MNNIIRYYEPLPLPELFSETHVRQNEWLKPVLDVLVDNGLVVSATDGDRALIININTQALIAANQISNFFSYEAVQSILRKDLIGSYLSTYGFPVLQTKIIKTYDDIDFDDFKIEPTVVPTRAPRQFFSHNWYKTKSELLTTYPVETFNDILASGSYMIHKQQYDVTPERYRVTAIVNGSGEIYFPRVCTRVMTNGQRWPKEMIYYFDGFDDQKTLIQNFLTTLGVKSVSFSLDFIKIDNVLYPMNPFFAVECRSRIEHLLIDKNEFDKVIKFQYDIPDSNTFTHNTWHCQYSATNDVITNIEIK